MGYVVSHEEPRKRGENMPGKEQTSVAEEEERKKIDLKIQVKDFGPISSGEITLKPLTVFIGPNNSGKSYAAMLIHSIFESYVPTKAPWFRMRGRTIDSQRLLLKEIVDLSLREYSELRRQFDNLEEGKELIISKQFVEAMSEKAVTPKVLPLRYSSIPAII